MSWGWARMLVGAAIVCAAGSSGCVAAHSPSSSTHEIRVTFLGLDAYDGKDAFVVLTSTRVGTPPQETAHVTVDGGRVSATFSNVPSDGNNHLAGGYVDLNADQMCSDGDPAWSVLVEDADGAGQNLAVSVSPTIGTRLCSEITGSAPSDGGAD